MISSEEWMDYDSRNTEFPCNEWVVLNDNAEVIIQTLDSWTT